MASDVKVILLGDRPALIPTVAAWCWDAFDRSRGRSIEHRVDRVAASSVTAGLPRTFVMLVNGTPVGTATFAAQDLPERPELAPWLASVVVGQEFRGRGYAAGLVEAVEAAAKRDGVPTLWLHTERSERLYARLGWVSVECLSHNQHVVTLMRRDF